MKKSIALLLALVMVFCLFAGCGQKNTTAETSSTKESATEKPATEKPAQEETPAAEEGQYLQMRLWLNQTQSGMLSTFSGAAMYFRLIFETLMTYDTETNTYNPWLAESLDISDDGLTYTVKLRDSKFHDGTPVTADDVIFTYNAVVIGGGYRASKVNSLEGFADAQSGKADSVSGIEKIDDKTIAFHLSAPNSLFIDGLANTDFAVLPASYFADVALTDVANCSFWVKPVGSGPYSVTEVSYPDYAVLSRVEDYYEPGGVAQILCTYYADDDARNNALITGDLDFGTSLGQEVVDLIQGQNPDLVFNSPATSYRRYLDFNFSGKAGDTVTHPSLGSAKVRQALSMLIDKESICALFGDSAVPLTSDINPDLPSYNSDLPTFKRDVEGAKAILDAEGFDYNTPLRLFTDYTDQTTTDLFELLVQNFADAGVTLEYTQDENWEPYYTTADFDLVYNAGMDMNVINFYNGLAIQGRNAYNAFIPMDDSTFVANITARYDDLINQYLATTDTTEQAQLLDQLQYNNYEDCLRIPLYSVCVSNCYNSAHVSGFVSYARDYEEVVDLKVANWKLMY